MLDRNKVKEILQQIITTPIFESKAGFNFRCVICRDSKVSKKKRRGWVLIDEKKKKITYYCHNCGKNYTLSTFLKYHYPNVYNIYSSILISSLENVPTEAVKDTIAKEIKDPEHLIKKDLRGILDLVAIPILSKQSGLFKKALQLRALRYLKQRKIPSDRIKELYVGFDDYITSENKYFLSNTIIIPFTYKDKIYTFQARTLRENSTYKYITIKEENEIKIYNYFNAEKDKPVFITEGPIDSWFIENSIATAGTVSVGSPIVELIKNTFKDRIWVFDNDTAGWKRTKDFINSGEKCFVWTPDWKKFKDINKVVEGTELTPKQVTSYIVENSGNSFRDKVKIILDK